MYSEQIESLIHLAIVDGELTEKEKQILFKKAAAEGIDLDEFEMVLNAKLFEKQRTEKSTIPSVDAPKSTKLGDVKKCPACGAITKPFHIKCAECGHEFSNIDANVSISKLFEMLNACDEDSSEDSITSTLGSFMAQGLGLGDKLTSKKKSIISGFPIPNTKDDILEFLSIAVPNAKQKGNMFTKNNPENKNHNDLAPTWKSKCEQIIIKAKFSMKDDKKTLEEIMLYANELGIK